MTAALEAVLRDLEVALARRAARRRRARAATAGALTSLALAAVGVSAVGVVSETAPSGGPTSTVAADLLAGEECASGLACWPEERLNLPKDR